MSDSGEVARIVQSTQGGFVAKPDTEELVQHLNSVISMSETEINDWVDSANNFAKKITWDNVLERLVVPYL